VRKLPGILSIKEGSDWIIVEASSGNYDFEVRSVKGDSQILLKILTIVI